MGKTIGEIEISNFSISPKYRIKNWNNAKKTGDWNLAAKIFYDRIESRYLKPVRLIANDDKIGEFSGFAILAIDCLIIETLNQFYNGLDETKGKHWKAFWHIFKNSPHFKPFFNRKKTEIFYSHFRCGILHQAQTKANSLVRIDHSKMIEEVNSGNKSDGLIVDREKFHAALENEINDYVKKIKANAPEDKILMDNFVKKMDYICKSK